MKKAYTSIRVGAVSQKTALNAKKANADGPTDKPTNIAGCSCVHATLKSTIEVNEMEEYVTLGNIADGWADV